MTLQHTLDTSSWLAFPFTVNGVNYVSKVKPDSNMLTRIALVPQTVFISMNEDCVRELIGNVTREQAIQKLYEINLNASEAVIEIV
jgi:hypothetical protein